MHQCFRLVVAYDGTDFKGWQVQKDAETIAATLQNSFQRLFNSEAIILGASRTDTGVHAIGQVVRLRTPLDLDSQRLCDAWQDALPPSILIRSLEKVDESFHPHHGVVSKTYWYHLFLQRPLPFVARYGWLYPFRDSVDWDLFEKCLQEYVGEHDFGSFCSVGSEEKTIRTIDAIHLKPLRRFNTLRIAIHGKGFARFQIRRMVGYALDVARRPDLSLSYLQSLLENPDPRQKLGKAAAEGLVLRKIAYQPN